MTEPLLYFHQGNPIGYQCTGTGVTQIVKAGHSQVVLFQQFPVAVCDMVWIEGPPILGGKQISCRLQSFAIFCFFGNPTASG